MEKGQTLLELIIAIGIFVAVISTLSFFIFNGYIFGRLSREMAQAGFLAQEGLEAAAAIRDDNFSNLVSGPHGLAIIGNQWVFQGAEENIAGELDNGTRKVIVEDLDADTKKITSTVGWQFGPGRNEEVRLVTYLTNWQRVPGCRGACAPCTSFANRGPCNNQDGCNWNSSLRQCQGTCVSCDNFSSKNSCKKQSGCVWQ